MIRYAIQKAAYIFWHCSQCSTVSHMGGHRTVMKSHLLDQVFLTAIKSMLANVLQYRKKIKSKTLTFCDTNSPQHKPHDFCWKSHFGDPSGHI